MNNSKEFVLLLGKHTKYLTKFVKWEVEYAKYLKLPIIIVNLNKSRNIDYDLMPNWFDNYPYVVCSFEYPIIKYSLDNWAELHESYLKKGNHSSFYWKESVYRELGLK